MAAWLLALAAQVSGYTNSNLATGLGVIGGLLLLWPAVYYFRSRHKGIVHAATLSDDQKRRLFKEIQEFRELSKRTLIIGRPGEDADAQALAFQFRNFFDKAKINSTIDWIRPEPGQVGIMVAVQDVVDPPPEAVSLHKALVGSGIEAKMVAMPRDGYKSAYVLMIGPTPH